MRSWLNSCIGVAQLVERLPPTVRLGLVTFGACVTMYNLGSWAGIVSALALPGHGPAAPANIQAASACTGNLAPGAQGLAAARAAIASFMCGPDSLLHLGCNKACQWSATLQSK